MEGVDFEGVPTLVLHWHHPHTLESVKKPALHISLDVFVGHCGWWAVVQEVAVAEGVLNQWSCCGSSWSSSESLTSSTRRRFCPAHDISMGFVHRGMDLQKDSIHNSLQTA